MICLSVLRFPPVMIFIITVMAAGPEFGAKGRIDRLVWYGFDLVGQKTYSSESGVYTVEVDLRDPMWVGRYSAAYRFSADGKRVWSEERPYTLREVVVTNTGMVVGFAYRSELEATGERNDPRDYFHIVIIDRHGREILNDVTDACLFGIHVLPRCRDAPTPSNSSSTPTTTGSSSGSSNTTVTLASGGFTVCRRDICCNALT